MQQIGDIGEVTLGSEADDKSEDGNSLELNQFVEEIRDAANKKKMKKSQPGLVTIKSTSSKFK